MITAQSLFFGLGVIFAAILVSILVIYIGDRLQALNRLDNTYDYWNAEIDYILERVSRLEKKIEAGMLLKEVKNENT